MAIENRSFLDLDPFHTEISTESDDKSKSNEVSGLMQLFPFTVSEFR